MADEILYDNLSQNVTNEDSSLANGQFNEFSFKTGASAGTLSDLKAILIDGTPGDGGDIAIELDNTSGTQLAALGLISDAGLSFSTTPTDIPITSSYVLAANTTYLIKFTGVLGSMAKVGAVPGDNTSGTGVAGSTTTYKNGPTSYINFIHDIAQVTETVACYRAGTRVRTPAGEVEVERLRVGDLVVTASGRHRPIRWLGHRAYARRFVDANPALLPICVRAGAIAETVPCRDLWVSPKHALYLDGVLIPAEALVNGTSVFRAERVDELVYWHVELDSHDVLLAENTPAESFVNDEGRGAFHNAQTFAELYPDAVEAEEADYCAPRHDSGQVVGDLRRRLAARAGDLGWSRQSRAA